MEDKNELERRGGKEERRERGVRRCGETREKGQGRREERGRE